jgi:hypothetical protein
MVFIFIFDGLYLTNGKLLDSLMWSFFFTYNLNIDLLLLRAIGFIKSHIYCDFNQTGGFIESTISMFVSSITKHETLINLWCKLLAFGFLVKYETLRLKNSKVVHLGLFTG